MCVFCGRWYFFFYLFLTPLEDGNCLINLVSISRWESLCFYVWTPESHKWANQDEITFLPLEANWFFVYCSRSVLKTNCSSTSCKKIVQVIEPIGHIAVRVAKVAQNHLTRSTRLDFNRLVMSYFGNGYAKFGYNPTKPIEGKEREEWFYHLFLHVWLMGENFFLKNIF